LNDLNLSAISFGLVIVFSSAKILTTASNLSWLLPITATLNPYSAKYLANPKPIPSVPPETTTHELPYLSKRLYGHLRKYFQN